MEAEKTSRGSPPAGRTRLLEFKNDQTALVELIRRIHQQGLKASPYLVSGTEGNKHPLKENDPLSHLIL